MAKINAAAEIINIKDDEQRTRYIQLFLQNVLEQVNGSLEITDNIKAKFIDVTFTSANTNFSIAHGLGRAPLAYIVAGKSVAAVDVYDGDGTATKSLINLKSAGVGTAKILFF